MEGDREQIIDNSERLGKLKMKKEPNYAAQNHGSCHSANAMLCAGLFFFKGKLRITCGIVFY